MDEQHPPCDEAALLPPGRSMQAEFQRVDHHTVPNEVLSCLQYFGPYILEQYLTKSNLVCKPIRVRIRYSCHQCKAGFALARECPECKHRRCKQCIRYPPRRASCGSKLADDLLSQGQSSHETSLQ
jgi:hypothetical protein